MIAPGALVGAQSCEMFGVSSVAVRMKVQAGENPFDGKRRE
jgi:hypothetical protein